jgi:GH35 family endo-1,4-beta-xylanase
MKKTLTTILICLLSFMGVQAQLSTNPYKFLGNITTRYNVDAGGGVPAYYTLWNQITCENESKWASVEGTRGSFNWGCDKAFNYAKQHKFTYKFHALVWGAQYPGWLESLSAKERFAALTNWFNKVKAKYNTLPMIDVVNEAVGNHQAGNPMMKETLGGGGKTGYDWLVKAFEMAYERWPDAILIYNDYNSLRWDVDNYITLVQTLRDAGAPIDAYGNQSHDVNDISSNELSNVLKKQQDALQMPMFITELDIDKADDAQQKAQYQKVLPLMWEAPYCAGVTLWGYIHGATWVDNSGLYKNGVERPAMTWIKEYMASDKAKNAVSPLPGTKKEASIYIRPASLKVAKGDVLPIKVRARLATKTIEKVDLYVGSELVKTMTEAPYIAEYTTSKTGWNTTKAVVTATDGSTYERYGRFNVLSSTTKREPYNETAFQLPGTISVTEFDKGASGVSYSNASRNLVATKDGAWMEYTVDVAEEGTYAFDAEVASTKTGGMFHLAEYSFDNLDYLTEYIEVPNTGSTTDYQTLHCLMQMPLTAGRHVLCLNIDKGGFYIKNLAFSRYEEGKNITVTINSIRPSTISVGDSAVITVTPKSTDSTIEHVKLYANDMLIATLTESPYTYAYYPATKGTYTIVATATDAEGRSKTSAKKTLKVNGKRTPYKEMSLPGIVQFEDFDKGGEGLSFHDSDANDEGDAKYRTDNEGVDIVKGNGGNAIGYTAANEWLEYTVNVTKAGVYNCEATVSSGTTGAAFTVSLRDNGQTKQLCKFTIPQTASNSWDTYATVSAKLSQELPEGQHILRVTITGANGNLDKMEFTREGGDEPPVTADSNFYVYLCFGQSNMEGNATPEAIDKTNVDPRFQTLACVNFSSPQRTMGQWYTATPPIVRQGTGLGMADYFGRTMVKNLPENVQVGVVDVAIGGTKIEGFMQDQVASYIASMNPSSEGWLINYFKEYDNDPYQRLVDMAKIAQQKGVIKGILLHQGESNNGQSDWPQKVKKIYDSLIADLGLNAADVPLFVGETVSQAEGGACWHHNAVIAKVPSVIPNSYVISSANCPQKGDGLHFTAQGYRIMGARYAKQALKLMGIDAVIDEPEEPSSEKEIAQRFTSIDAIGSTPFAIVEETSGKAFFGSDNQNLGFDSYAAAFVDTNTGYLFKMENSSANNGYLLRLIQPNGDPYSIWGSPGYLNSQPVDGWCSFILGLNNQNGQDLENGAVWDIQYVAGKGFTLKNVGTGKYLQDANTAKYDDPAYFTFCTLRAKTGIAPLTIDRTANAGIFTLQGVKVGTTEEWSTLPKGVYIVDGKLRMKR